MKITYRSAFLVLVTAGLMAFAIGQVASSTFQNIELLDAEGNVIGLLFENTPHVLISQSANLQRIQASGWVYSDFTLSNQTEGQFEHSDGLLKYDDLAIQNIFGNSVRLVGLIQNDSENCYSAIRAEASLWDANGDLNFIDQFTIWQVHPGDRVPFRTDRIFTSVEEANQLNLRLRFLEGTACTSSSGSGGGGGGIGDS